MKRLLLPFLITAGVVLSSCTEEAVQPDQGFALHYPAISEIAPSTNITVTPTWYGNSPSEFTITSITRDSEPVETECFAVDPDNGVFSISASDDLPTGVYTIGISCMSGGSCHNFPEALVIEMMKPIPDGIVVEPSSISASLSDILTTGKGTTLPTATVKTDGNNHVEIKEYLISNVYFNGALANEYKDWFAISEDGVFSIVPDNPDFEPGNYKFDLKLVTYIVGKNSEKGIFKDALSLSVTSAPLKVTYSPATAKAELGTGAVSVAPSVKGSLEGLKYELKSVSPDNSVGIKVDASTGVISFPASATAAIGACYDVNLTISNDYGSDDFESVFLFEVIAYLDPITKFSYQDIDELISGVSFTNAVKEMDGASVIYSFVNLPQNLSALTLDPETGAVSCAKGVELPVGRHTVTVRAENAKGSRDASFAINVIANPNHFTYVRWGNNLGPDGAALTPLEKYGNQFRVMHGEGTVRFPIVESDIPAGRPVKYEGVKPSTANGGISVNTTNGRLDVYGKAAGTAVSTLAFTVVHVTVGEGEAAVTRKFPVFADLCGPEKCADGQEYLIKYTPFAIHVNPKTGGVSEAPEITSGGTDVSDKVSLDYQTNMMYYNINGPASHENPEQMKNDTNKDSFLVNVWQRYLDALGKSWNSYAVGPMSYWENYKNGNLGLTGGYVDATDHLKIRVNPEKFKDLDGVYADGAMYMTMKFSPSGANPQTSGDAKQMNRAFIWLDPNYTE